MTTQVLAAAAKGLHSPNPAADGVRIVLLTLTVLLGLLVVRFALTRITHPEGDDQRAQSGWGLLSYAAAIAIAVYDGFHRFGEPLSIVRTPLSVVMLVSGLVGAFYGRTSLARLPHPPGKGKGWRR